MWKEGNDLDVKSDEHVEKRVEVQVDEEKMAQERAVCVDISREGGQELEFGKETLMVNASIMTLTYKPLQGPWLVDVDLPKAD